MSADGSVTVWIKQLQDGDADAAQPLWDRYFQDLVRLAQARLRGGPRRATDEEDVALAAFDSFCRGVAAGRFPQLRDRDNLWPLLFQITVRKVSDARRHEAAQKRGGGAVGGESAWLGTADDADRGIEQVVGTEPTPAFAAEVAEEIGRWLDALGSDELRQVAVWKMEGYTNAEIARLMDTSETTVERRLKLIRGLLEREANR